MTKKIFTIPADYGCFAILDPESYLGFVSEDWTIQGLKKHFIEQNERGALISWGCGCGNWIVKLVFGSSNETGFRSFESGIKTNGKLLLTTYESLTMAAQFEDVTLPETHEVGQVIKVASGNYKVTVVQCFSTEEAESDKVFNQTTPHYIVSLESTNNDIVPVKEVPWFEGY